MSFDFDHAHKRRQEIAKSISGSFNADNLEKAEAYQDTTIGTPFDNQSRIAMNISQSYSNAPEISKAEEEGLEKGGKKAFIGETRTHGGREYIRTASGWKYHPKGTSKPAEAKKEEAKPASGKHIGDMSATEKKTLADKLGVDVKGKTTKQVDKALSDAMVDKQMADWKAKKDAGKSEESVEALKRDDLIKYIAEKVNYNIDLGQSIPEYEIMNAIKEFEKKFDIKSVELLEGQPIALMSKIRQDIRKLKSK